MSTDIYREILNQIQHLSPGEKRQLLEDVAKQLPEETPPRRRHSIMEFKGLGKEIWNGIDAQEYVRQERESWKR
jgi:hypothetical protein